MEEFPMQQTPPCSRCGQAVPVGGAFCPNCGASMQATLQSAPTEGAANAPTQLASAPPVASGDNAPTQMVPLPPPPPNGSAPPYSQYAGQAMVQGVPPPEAYPSGPSQP